MRLFPNLEKPLKSKTKHPEHIRMFYFFLSTFLDKEKNQGRRRGTLHLQGVEKMKRTLARGSPRSNAHHGSKEEFLARSYVVQSDSLGRPHPFGLPDFNRTTTFKKTRRIVQPHHESHRHRGRSATEFC